MTGDIINRLSEIKNKIGDTSWRLEFKSDNRYSDIKKFLKQADEFVRKACFTAEEIRKDEEVIDDRVEKLAQFLDSWGDNHDIAVAYYKSSSGRFFNALKVIEDYDDDEHDYTSELTYDLMEWEKQQREGKTK